MLAQDEFQVKQTNKKKIKVMALLNLQKLIENYCYKILNML